jgi:hypothetical protein
MSCNQGSKEIGLILDRDKDYIYYLDEPCKILISEVEIIDKSRIILQKNGLIKVKQQEQ